MSPMAGQQLCVAGLSCWVKAMALAFSDPAQLEQLQPWLNRQFSGQLHALGLLDPEPCKKWVDSFARSFYRTLAQWRQPVDLLLFP